MQNLSKDHNFKVNPDFQENEESSQEKVGAWQGRLRLKAIGNGCSTKIGKAEIGSLKLVVTLCGKAEKG
jgi:hypothetical protein